MTRAEWLASLQTFEKVWLPTSGAGSVVTVLVMADGRILDLHWPRGDRGDLRAWPIEPVPEAPWGRCPKCSRPMANAYEGKDRGGECLRCWWDAHPPACPGGCKSQEEHDAKVREQRVRCGLAPEDAEPVH